MKPNVWFKVNVRNEDNALLDKVQKEDALHGGHGEHEAEAGHCETEHGTVIKTNSTRNKTQL